MNKNYPLISIIIPIYNTEKYLKKCIDSVLSQTYDNLEIILIDDGSSDNSLSICQWYEKRYNKVKVIHQTNMGVSLARNVGINVAKGKLISFVDSDDWIESSMLEKLYLAIEKTNSDISFCNFSNLNHEESNNNICHNQCTTIKSNDALKEVLIGTKIEPTVCGKLFRTGCLKNKYFDSNISIGEDMLMLCQILIDTQKIAYVNYKAYHYYNRSNSAVSTYNKSYWSIQKSNDLIIKCVQNKFETTVDYAMARSIYSDICLAIFSVDTGNLNYDSYKKIYNHIEKYKKKSVYRYLATNIKIWLFLFVSGRTIFIIFRRLYSKLK